MMLEALEIRIERWNFEGKRMSELRIRATVNGQEFNSVTPLPVNDLLPMFDRIWDSVGRELKHYLEKHVVENEDGQPTLTPPDTARSPTH